MTAEVPVCETCGQQHLTKATETKAPRPSCPGHVRNGDGRRYPDGTRGPTREPGAPCMQPLGFRTGHPGIGCCYFHGGMSPNHIQAAQMEMARMECDRLGVLIGDGDPIRAMRDALRRAEGNLVFYETAVRELELHPEDDVLEEGYDGKPHYVRGEPGIYGRTYHVSGIPTGEAKEHILVKLYHEAERWFATVSEKAAKLGIEERQQRLSETLAAEVLTALSAALDAGELTREQSEVVRRVFASRFERQVPLGIGEPAEPEG